MIDFWSSDPRDELMTIILKIDFEQFLISKMAANMASPDLSVLIALKLLHIAHCFGCLGVGFRG